MIKMCWKSFLLNIYLNAKIDASCLGFHPSWHWTWHALTSALCAVLLEVQSINRILTHVPFQIIYSVNMRFSSCITLYCDGMFIKVSRYNSDLFCKNTQTQINLPRSCSRFVTEAGLKLPEFLTSYSNLVVTFL